MVSASAPQYKKFTLADKQWLWRDIYDTNGMMNMVQQLRRSMELRLDYSRDTCTLFSAEILSLDKSIDRAEFGEFLSRVDQFVEDNFWRLRETLTAVQAQSLLLKISNLLVLKYEYRYRHTILIGHPIGTQVDPSNSCGLKCPGCVHTSNKNKNFIWPVGTLSPDIFEMYLEEHGPYMFEIYFANYGEPFLNKNFEHLVTMTRRFGLSAFTSSSLSVPKFDADSIVRSGLNFLIVSIDGASDTVYRQYRRGGNFDTVLKNLRALVQAKIENDSYTPVIHWQFLLFEHNKHEADSAVALAQEIGVNQICLAKPFDVAWDDPNMVPAIDLDAETIIFTHDGDQAGAALDAILSDLDGEVIGSHFDRTWTQRWHLAGRPTGLSRPAGNDALGCEWLYKSASLDATGRVMPCARPPATNARLVFGDTGKTDIFNGPLHQRARRFFRNPPPPGTPVTDIHDPEMPYCEVCEHANTKLDIDTREIVANQMAMGGLYSVVSEQARKALTDW
jgi:MoaA/NifB/PqqE/SkfB family radical SAM enzyme